MSLFAVSEGMQGGKTAQSKSYISYLWVPANAGGFA